MATPTEVKRPVLICWHPLLPAFSARLIFALRTLIGIVFCAMFTLYPTTSNIFQGQLLLGVGFIVAMKSTLGATVQNAVRLFLGGAIATCYCLLIVNLCPRTVYFGVGATNVLVLLIVYTDLPVTVRRFSIVPTCIVLLQWITKPHVNTRFVLQVWGSLTLGASLAVLVSCLPMPMVATAYRELTMRMRFLARQTRRETTAILLLISEYHNQHLKSNYDQRSDHGIEMERSASVIQAEEEREHLSSSYENLRDDHLLSSDIQDLNSLVNDEIKQMQRAWNELSNEPYFIALNLWNCLRRLLRHLPGIKRFVSPPSTLETRLGLWVTGFVSLQRTINGMLTLHHHHHAFVGQRQLINSLCFLLDSTFNYLDSTLPYTTASKNYFHPDQIRESRMKVENALEEFFEIYTLVRENPHHAKISTSDAVRLNTFLLLILRLVHVTMTTAENTQTPGTSEENEDEETTTTTTMTKTSFHWKQPIDYLVNYIGLRPSTGKLIRSIKTSLSVLVSAIVVFSLRERLQAYGWVYWAPMTTALVSDSSEGGTLRLSFQRLMAVLLGSTYAYVIILVTQDRVAVGVCISLFVGLMGYLKTDPQKEYFASVCAQSASIITFLSNQKGQMSASNKAVLARTSLTFLGIFIHVFISNLFFPITARSLIKKKIDLMLKNVSLALESTIGDFCSLIESNSVEVAKKPSASLLKLLGETERMAESFPALLEEALNEPNFWKRPFIQVKDRYDDLGKSLRQIVADIRFVHRCTTILKAESKLHFAQQAKWQLRRASLIPSGTHWTLTELRKEKQLLKDLDIPLRVFMSHSPTSTEHNRLISNTSLASLRLANISLYQPVLEQIRSLEKQIEEVIQLTGQLIVKQGTVDLGTFELEQFSSDDQEETILFRARRTLPRGPSFYAVPQFEGSTILTNHYQFFSCCCRPKEKELPSLPSLRHAVHSMLSSLIDFLQANNRFIRHEFVSYQSIGDVLAFHTLSYALKDLVEATTNLAKNARRIKHIDTRTLIPSEREEKYP